MVFRSLSFFKVLCLFSFTFLFVKGAVKRDDLPPPLPITTNDIRFELIPNEPGPEWRCLHRPVASLPYDWRVQCRSLTSSAELNFYVHFLIRIQGNANQFLEILYWVDEQMSFNGKVITLSHGQSTMLTTGQSIDQIAFNLGQLVQNGTSHLNIFLSKRTK